MTDFEFGIERHASSFSDASRIAQIMMDPEMMRHSRQAEAERSYPPILTPRDIGSQYFVRSESLSRDQEEATVKAVQQKLVKWSTEGFFEVVPIATTDQDNIGFRITTKGIEVANASFERAATNLTMLARTANRHLGLLKD